MAERGGKRRPALQLDGPSKSYNYGYKKEFQGANEARKVATLVGDYSDSDSGSDSSTEDKDEKVIAEDPKPAAEVKLAAEVKPAAEVKLAAEVKPAAEVKLAAEVKPAAQLKTAAELKPAAELKLAAEVKPAAQLKPAAKVKPAAEVKPAVEVVTEFMKTETPPPRGEKTDVLDDELKHFFSEIEAIPGPLPVTQEEDQAVSTEADDDQISEDPKAEVAEDIKTLDATQPAPKKFQYPMFVKGESEFVHSPQRAEEEAESLHKEPEGVDIPEEPTTAWQMVQDEHTSYYYYWNIETNQVTWDIPTEYTQYLLLHREYEEKMARYSPEELLKFKKLQLMKKVDSSKGNRSEPEKTTASNLTTTRTTHPQQEAHLVASAGIDSVSHNLSDVPSSRNVFAAPEEDLSSLSPRRKKEKRRHHKKKHKQKDETSPPNQRKHLPKREKTSPPESSVVMVKPMANVESKLLSIVPYLSDDEDEENSDTCLETQVSSATEILDSLAEVFDSKPLSSDVVVSMPLVSEVVQNADVLATAAFLFEPPPPPPPLEEEEESIKEAEKETEAVHKNITAETLPGDDGKLTDSSPLHVLHTNAETKIDMFEDDLSKVDVCLEESSKIDMFEDESPKLGTFKDKSSKIDMFKDESSKIDMFKDEPTKTDMFEDESTKTDMFEDESTKIDMFEDESSLDVKKELLCDDKVKKEVLSVNAILPQICSLEHSEIVGNSQVKVLDESVVAGNEVFQLCEKRDRMEDSGNRLNVGDSNEMHLETLESIDALDVREEVVILSKHSVGVKESRESNSFKKEVELDHKSLTKNVNIVEYGDSTLEEDLESSGNASRNRETSKKKKKESRKKRDLDENTDKSMAVNKNEKKDSLKPHRSDKNTDLIVSRKVEKKEDTLKRHVKDSNRDLDRYGKTDKKDDSWKSNRKERSADLRESGKADKKDDFLKLSRVDRNSDLSSSGKLKEKKDSLKMQRVDNIPIASGKTEKRYDSSKLHRTDENTNLNKSSKAEKKDKSSKSHRGNKNKEPSTSGKVEKKDDSLKPHRKDRNTDINKSVKVEKTNESSKSHQVDKNKDLRTSGKTEKKDDFLKPDRVDRNIDLDTLCTTPEDKESLTSAPGHRKRSHQEVEDDDADLDFNIDEIDLALEAALEKKKAEQLALKSEIKLETVAEVLADAEQAVLQPQQNNEESSAAVKKESSATKSEDNEEDKMAQEADLAQQKKEIQEIAELALKKLEFLDVTTENLSQLQLLLIEIMTRYTDWMAGGLSTQYFSGQLKKAGDMLEQYELCAVPEGWTCEWDRTNCRYFYRNKLSNQTQWEYPDVTTNQDKSELPEADSGDAAFPEDSSVRSRDSHKSKNSLSPRHKKKEEKKKHVKHSASRHSHRKRRERSESSNGYSSDDSRQHHHRHKSKKKKRHRKERSPHSERREKSNELINIESDEDVCIIEPVGSSNSAPEKSKSVVQENISVPVMDNTTLPLTDSTSLPVTDSMQQTVDPDIDGISLSDPEDVLGELLNPSDDTALSGAASSAASVDHETIKEVSIPNDNNKMGIPEGTVNTAVISKPPQIIIHPSASLSNLQDARLPSAQALTSASSEADPLADRRIPVVTTRQTEPIDPLVDGEPLTKKKKKDKKAASSSLMMKKKQVTTLVQKWQKVKKEVEKEDRVKEMRQAAIRAKIEELKTHPDKQ